jgi:hypothetical protein
MGATASLAASLPERMDETQMQSVCQKRFNKVVFDENCDENKMISRDKFIELVTQQQETEVQELYNQFCLTRDAKKTDLITCEQLLGFCLHCKIFSKSRFSSQKCADMFGEIMNDSSNKEHTSTEVVMDSDSSVKKVIAIDFHLFRNALLPRVAESKGIGLDKLIFKLSRVEAATVQTGSNYVVNDDYDPENLEEPSVNIYVQAMAKKVKMRRQLSGQNSFKRRPDMTDEEAIIENVAASKVQTTERKRQARKVINTLRKINFDAFHANAEKDFDNNTYDDTLETALQEKFLQYSNRCHEMDCKGFVKMCGECGLYGQKFTKVDAQCCFDRGKARGECLPQCTVLANLSKIIMSLCVGFVAGCPEMDIELNLSVILGKRVTYLAFRKAIIKCVAETRNATPEHVMDLFLD